MTDMNNKIAFVTGAASGIGLSLCKMFLEKGAKVMMADIDEKGLLAAREELGGGDAIAHIVCDVAEYDSIKAAADETIRKFGKVHIVVNNAGVSLAGRPGQIYPQDWRWINDINMMGVAYGCEIFIPLILSHGEGGHVVNTASMAGHIATVGMGPYFATKFGVVGYSEALFHELKSVNIGVSCLCPTWVQSNIHNTADKSPMGDKTRERFKTSSSYMAVKDLIENGMSPDRYAALCGQSIEANRLYVFNDASARQSLVERHKSVLADYDACLEELKDL
ncbi:NADP-dependent 3-hydroxy acid dehydrogenase YdfG [Litorimonas taeanensis]|uniref:NADP-dependent 3-hydroxy acid dehydrogenase YdfG n=1 Tax=Litorimonas taeanensis TaxID=568099 RepID=A0A420WE93_9PROT|nr:SDR family NAD(P)-dependent oxidoreductase [Litorimonas taeanensis]RKQ69230.1 NADP-dependent 3-hydroxy acid dehydrogenase YdfG [Litorimonas taeanensis]